MSRPPKEINWEQVLLRMQSRSTAAQISQYFNIDTDTFYRRFKQEFGCGFQDFAAREKECGASNISYMQYTKALKGSEKMLTLLGREWLGQGEEIRNLSAPNQELIEAKAENSRLRYRLKIERRINNELRPNGNEPETGDEP